MNNEQNRDMSREQFEAWHRSVVAGEPPHEKYSNGDYRNQHVQRYWLGWQASREAVLVELQAEIDGYVRERREAIEAQIPKVAE
ncbi:hypothetical protein [Pseudomonas faucium]|uniref:hypothetical protein n=1 Tax=Pseudomonas faucium TaxID=2740518 RepID=UPI001F1FD813|nr:hypothetical protein [Pseudomonas faucium]